MPLTLYRAKNFTPDHQAIINNATAICEEYAEDGLVLTLRQLYYQFVARGLIQNVQTEYDRLGGILTDARMAGAFDWNYLIDRTRNIKGLAHQESPEELVRNASDRFRPDLWKDQHQRVEVWIEKDAAIGVVEGVCERNDVPYFSCRGYTSMSEMWAAGNRLRFHLEDGDKVTVLHIGDHDPSGLDMTDDITSRLRTFIHQDWAAMHMGLGRHTRGDIYESMREHLRSKGAEIGEDDLPWQVKRIALNLDQIEQYDPPPNPVKLTDSRFAKYSATTGLEHSWELDALEPNVLQRLIQEEVEAVRDEDQWANMDDEMHEGRATLRAVAANWAAITEQYGVTYDEPEEQEDD